jgi:hypothetical protein
MEYLTNPYSVYMEYLTNPYSVYGALYKAIFVDSYNYGPVFIPKRKKLKGYQKRK